MAALAFGSDDAGQLTDADQTMSGTSYHTALYSAVSATLNRLTLNYPGQATGIWTGSDFSCDTDINRDGFTGATDRSLVSGAWSRPTANCAP